MAILKILDAFFSFCCKVPDENLLLIAHFGGLIQVLYVLAKTVAEDNFVDAGALLGRCSFIDTLE